MMRSTHILLVSGLLAPSGAAAADQLLAKATEALQKKDYEAAADACRKAAQANPRSADAFDTLGVVRWSEAFPAVIDAKRAAGISPAQAPPIGDAQIRNRLHQTITPGLVEGHAALAKALSLEPGFGDALLYQNLLYRLAADVAASRNEASELMARADQAIESAKALKEAGKWKQLDPALPPPPPPPKQWP
jgi:hypothetical protein